VDRDDYLDHMQMLDAALLQIRRAIGELDIYLPTWDREYTTGINREATVWLERAIATFERRAVQPGGPLSLSEEVGP
jgi:hypothetical protein